MKITTQDLPMIEPAQDGAKDTRNPKLLAAARMYEKQFLGEMVKAMRKTVENGGLIEDSMGEQIFREKLDDEYVETWGERGGIGLGDMIYSQVAERYGIGMPPAAHGPHRIGALPLSNREVKSFSQKPSSRAMQMRVQLESKPDAGPASLQTPWAGRLLAQGPLSDGRMFARVEHDSGLTSEFVFQGSLLPQKIGDQLPAKQSIGLLNPQNPHFDWNLQPSTKVGL
jgi:flagellar protein FlgJ